MPASGCINLHDCIVGIACSSIACAVDGNATGSKTLCTLSVTAGKSAPHSMSEFYGYAGATAVCINLGSENTLVSNACCCDVYFSVNMYNRVSPNVMTVCFIGTATLDKLVFSCWYTNCNGGSWVAKGGGTALSFSQTLVDFNDTVCVRMQLEDIGGFAIISDMDVSLCNPPAVFTTGSGTVIRCTPYYAQIALGAV